MNRSLQIRYGCLLAALVLAGCSGGTGQSGAGGDGEAASLPTKPDPGIPAPSSPVGFIKGHSWGFPGFRGWFSDPKAVRSMAELADTGAEWVCICFAVSMPSASTPELHWSTQDDLLATDEDVHRAIQLARDNDLKVILKPMVICKDGQWRAKIDFLNDSDEQDLAAWDSWWSQFNECLVHYAGIAEETECEMYCLGCEMVSTEPFDAQWRKVIADVRKVYHRPVTYDVNFTNDEFPEWLEDVDIISLSAYYPIGVERLEIPQPDGSTKVKWREIPTLEGMKERLVPIRDTLHAVTQKFDKPMLFIELGMCSADQASKHPWRHRDEVSETWDGEEQALFYRAFLETFWEEPWFIGFAWWDWPARLYEKEAASEHNGFAIYGKPAEDVVRQWYARKR